MREGKINFLLQKRGFLEEERLNRRFTVTRMCGNTGVIGG